MLRTWCAFSFFTCKCASRHNGVQFFISHLASWLRTRRFSEPTFRPSGKTQCFATFLPFCAPGSSFFSDFLFFDLLSSCLLFSDSSHLCFLFVHIVGSLTSKLPSTRNDRIRSRFYNLRFGSTWGPQASTSVVTHISSERAGCEDQLDAAGNHQGP